MQRVETLLVEDEDAQALLITRFLRTHSPNAAVTRVTNGALAMDVLRSGRAFDLVILDLHMPEMGGREVLGEICVDERLRTIPVVVFTGSEHELDRMKAYALGANAFVLKPQSAADYDAVFADIAAFWLRRNVYPPRGPS